MPASQHLGERGPRQLSVTDLSVSLLRTGMWGLRLWPRLRLELSQGKGTRKLRNWKIFWKLLVKKLAVPEPVRCPCTLGRHEGPTPAWGTEHGRAQACQGLEEGASGPGRSELAGCSASDFVQCGRRSRRKRTRLEKSGSRVWIPCPDSPC